MIWFLAGAMTLAALLYVARPLYSKAPIDLNPEAEVEDYANQIQELDAEIAREDGNRSELERAKIDLQRRLIKSGTGSINKNVGASAVLLSSLFVVFSFSAIGLYSVLGNPDMASKEAVQKTEMSVSRAISQNEEPQHENKMSLDQLVVQLEEKLRQDDRNPEGWMLYARSLMTLKRFDEALSAYNNVLILTDNNPNVLEEFESAKAFIEKAENLQFPSNATQTSPGPSAEDMKAAASMSDEDRQAMIQTMVDGLSAKLVDDPQNIDGWIRLLRARKVLQQDDEAMAEIERMKLALVDKPETVQMVLEASGWLITK
jgi:cytochrome c-type biogenesis protein CcmI